MFFQCFFLLYRKHQLRRILNEVGFFFDASRKRTEACLLAKAGPMTEVSRYFAFCFSWRILKKAKNYGFSLITNPQAPLAKAGFVGTSFYGMG